MSRHKAKIVFTVITILSIYNLSAQQLEVVKYDDLENLQKTQNTNLQVYNFWATWCAPCIKELPYFEALNEMANVDVYLVSLDFVEDQEKVEKFMAKKQLHSKVFLLNEKSYDAYMPRVNTDWSGAIPATLFVSPEGTRHFYEKAFTKEELTQKINKFIN